MKDTIPTEKTDGKEIILTNEEFLALDAQFNQLSRLLNAGDYVVAKAEQEGEIERDQTAYYSSPSTYTDRTILKVSLLPSEGNASGTIRRMDFEFKNDFRAKVGSWSSTFNGSVACSARIERNDGTVYTHQASREPDFYDGNLFKLAQQWGKIQIQSDEQAEYAERQRLAEETEAADRKTRDRMINLGGLKL